MTLPLAVRRTCAAGPAARILAAYLLSASGAGAQSLTFPVQADAWIKASRPTSNFGKGNSVAANNKPEHFLLKFTVSGIGSQPILGVKLQLYSAATASRGGDFYPAASSSWSETAVTWNSAPATIGSTPAASLGSIVSGRWYEVDLAALVQGDGTYSLRVTSPSSSSAVYKSREAGLSTAPRLVVTLAPAPLAVDAGPDVAGAEGVSLTFSASASGGAAPLAYSWTFGDGSTGGGATVSHVYPDNGAFTATLTVTDAAGQVRSDTASATITNVAPTVTTAAAVSGFVGQPVTFTALLTDPGAADVASGLSVSWDFGDGATGSGATASHTYLAAGSYGVSVTAVDKDGAQSFATSTATIVEPPPTLSCLDAPTGPILTVSGPRSSGFYNLALAESSVVDARTAFWYLPDANPVGFGGGSSICWSGGSIRGTYPPDAPWETTHSTEAVKTVGVGITVENVRAVTYGDGIKLYEGTEDFTIRGVHLDDMRDDCVEGDWLPGGVIEDSLLEGCYVAFAARPRDSDPVSDGSARTWVIRNVLAHVRPQIGVYSGPSPGNGSFFKWDTSPAQRSPKVAIHDTILRIDQYPSHTEDGLWVPDVKLESCSNVTLVWLGQGPYPVPLPPCVTLTTDVAVWDVAVTEWKARHLPPPEVTTVDVRVSASADDAEESASGSVSINSSDLELVDESTTQTVGVRFDGVEIPPGARILSAYVQFQVDEASAGPANLTVQGEDSDNAAVFAAASLSVSSRLRTTAAVSWSPPDWPSVGLAGPDQRTPDLAAVIQAIVDRPGWASGNALAIIVTGVGRRTAEAFDGKASAAPFLHVEY